MSEIQTKKCPQCGAPIDSTATSCKFCGAEVPIQPQPQQQQPQYQQPQYQQPQYQPPQVIIQQQSAQPIYKSSKNKVVAAVLAFFLGGIGIHKFYLGQGGMGVLYLLFSWTFIPVFIAFIEAIIYITMSDESFNQKYGVRIQ